MKSASGSSTITVGDEQVMPSELYPADFPPQPTDSDKVHAIQNALGEETTGYMEDLSAEPNRKWKQNYGLTSLRNLSLTRFRR